MNDQTSTELQTRVVPYIEQLMPLDEEQNPIPWRPSPGMLVVRVSERLARVGAVIAGTDEPEGEEASLDESRRATIHFIGAATAAISAIPHVAPDADGAEPIVHKDFLLGELDHEVHEGVADDGSSSVEPDPALWLAEALAALTDAYRAVGELEELLTPPVGARTFEDDDDSAVWELDEAAVMGEIDDLRETISTSLFEAAVLAAIAAESLLAHSEQPRVCEPV